MPLNKIDVIHSDEVPSNVVTVRTTKKIIRKVPKGQGAKFQQSDTNPNGQATKNNTDNNQILKDLGVVKRNARVSQKTTVTKTTTVKTHKVAKSRITNWVAVEDTRRMGDERNIVQVNSGQALAVQEIEKPLSQAWNRLNRIIPQMLFAFNVIVGVIDLALAPIFLYFKIPALIFGVVENIILAGTWFFKSTKFYKNADDSRKRNLDKQFQIFENLIQELLVYPSLVITAFNVVVGRFYDPDSPQTVLEIILLIFDVIALMYVYGIRIYMTRNVMNSLKRQVGLPLDTCNCFHVTTRFSINMILNTFLFGALLGMLTLQIHTENADTQDFTCSGWTVAMIFATFLIPTAGIALFCVVNYYWFLEMFVMINLNVRLQNDDIYNTAEQVEAPITKEILAFSIENTDATRERLNDIQQIKGSQRYFYSLQEWKCCIPLIAYAGLCCFNAAAFNSSYYELGEPIRFGSIILIAICNYQMASLVLIMIVYWMAVFFSWLVHKCGLQSSDSDEPLPTHDDKNNHVYDSYRNNKMPDVT